MRRVLGLCVLVMYGVGASLTDDLEVGRVARHGLGVDLTHVPSPIGLPGLVDVKRPRAVSAVLHRYPVVLRYHVVRYRQYRLGVDSKPCDLKHIFHLSKSSQVVDYLFHFKCTLKYRFRNFLRKKGLTLSR